MTSTDIFTASCPAGEKLLSCGLDNSQKTSEEAFRSTRPISTATCECYDYFGAICIAWCTNVPINGFEIRITAGSGNFWSTCSAGKKVIGCHIDPTASSAENWRHWYPIADGTGCACYDYYGADCIATCAANVNSYEIIAGTGTGYVDAHCSKPHTQVLGCGMNSDGAPQKEKWRTVRAYSKYCSCFDFYGTTCYAICGIIW